MEQIDAKTRDSPSSHVQICAIASFLCVPRNGLFRDLPRCGEHAVRCCNPRPAGSAIIPATSSMLTECIFACLKLGLTGHPNRQPSTTYDTIACTLEERRQLPPSPLSSYMTCHPWVYNQYSVQPKTSYLMMIKVSRSVITLEYS